MIPASTARAGFAARFGAEPAVYFAPGRVNLIGEHTDYNGGFVLPIALGVGTTVAVAPRGDRRLRAFSAAAGEPWEVDLEGAPATRSGRWTDYVEGVARTVEEDFGRLRGADLWIGSDVPLGAGLSSSAALEISVGSALLGASGLPSDPLRLARAAQRAEHLHAGTRCGLMDQLVSAMGREGAALKIDCRSFGVEQVPLALGSAAILVCDTGVKHALASSAYNARRAACEEACRILGVRALRDVELPALEAAKLQGELFRRARHVVSENARVLRAAELLRQGELRGFGELMVRSHASLRDDYQVSCGELDAVVDAALCAKGVYGARMTGGGFGGSAICLAESSALPELEGAVRARFRERFGREPTFLLATPRGGARRLDG